MICTYFAVLRHGFAENNAAEAKHRAGDPRAYDPAIKIPSSGHDLMDEGKEQAVKTGAWLKRHGITFSHHVVSGFVRAMRTASLLNIPNARWRIEERLCEKDSGILNTLTPSKVQAHIKGRGHTRHNQDPYRFRPEHGESFLDLDVRMRSVFEWLDDDSLVVCHGHVIRVLDRVIMEGMSAWEYALFNPVSGDIPNGALIEYRFKHGQWLRRQSVPHLGEPPLNDWKPIIRRTYSNESLIDLIDRVQAHMRAA